MGLIEPLFGDLLLLLMQNSIVRWGIALAASLWVWLIGDEEARLRKLYLLAPFIVAGLVELADMTGGTQGSRLSQLLIVQDAARRLASLVGFGAILLTLVLGYMRGIGFALGVAVLLCAYFVDGFSAKDAQRAFLAAVPQVLMLLPTVLVVLLTSYGLGASLRRARENRNRYD